MIVVSGRAEASIPADRATLSIAVETRAATAASAGSDNARIQQAVLTALKQAGVDPAKITTAGYTVGPEWRYEQGTRSPMPTGYAAHNTVRVDVTQLELIGKLIDASLAAGANRIDGVQFSASSTAEARRGALATAIANARADAQTMAHAAGGTLGRLVEVSTERFDAPPGVYAQMLRAGPAGGSYVETPIEPRAIQINVVVVTRWQLVLPAP
ncbi:MAG: SIMPL domain-containing protein [Gemmatimonadaceae bacterium]